jgi:hypothetical protein
VPEALVTTGKAWPGRETWDWREARTAEWAGEVLAGASTPAVLVIIVAVPASPFSIVGGLPPPGTAAPAALLVVSHVSLLVTVSSHIWTAGCLLTVTVAHRYVNDISLAFKEQPQDV